MIKHSIFSNKILFWYHNTQKQNLPWQINKTIYKIWISEIMLQQTQVATVIPYYEKFIKKFSTIFQLASAELNEILYIWSGLGYYKRAINLHKTAKIIVQNYNNKFPQDFDILVSLPGIGKSTAGAILSLGLNKQYPILDGNIKRILTRYYGLNNNIMKCSQKNHILWSLIEQLIPKTNIAIFNQAMMDLGRLICTYMNPKCCTCPINDNCKAYLTNTITNRYSNKKLYKKKSNHTIWWLILFFKNTKTVWLIKRSSEKIWQELFCFPEFNNPNSLNSWLLKHNLYHNTRMEITALQHQVSNINLKIQPILINIEKILDFNKNNNNHGIWYDLNTPLAIGIPKPVSLLLDCLYKDTIT